MRAPGDEPVLKLEGRAAEQAALRGALADARQGHGRIVVVSGEAGIGKSALLQALAAEATAAGLKPTWGRAWEFADAPPYFPLWPCLSALGLAAKELQGESPFLIWESVLESLSRASEREPCLWLLEDLHAADLQTLDLLVFLAQPLRVLPVLVVATARPHDARLSGPAQQRLLRMARDGLDLRLSPLSAQEVTRLAEQLVGELSPAIAHELLELTSGNPLFVLECARSLKERGAHNLRGISPTIRQVVLERLRLLPESTRELLESGSVLGRDFTAALLGRMHEVLPARVVDRLLPGLRGGVLHEHAPGSFSFSHVVVQGSIYDSMSAERRCLLHGLAQRALEALPDSPAVSLERARHALGALTPQTEQATLASVFAAGQALEESGAFDRAHALYARLREKVAASELTRALSGSELLHFAGVAERAGKSAEARSLSLAVLARARASRDQELFSQAALELGRGIRPGLIDQELVAALREALAQVDAQSPLGCRLLARLAAALQPHSDPQVPIGMANEAIARARQLGERALLLEVLDVAGSALVDYAPLELRLATAEELLERAVAARDFVRTQRARARLAFDRAVLGSFDAFDLQVSHMLREAEQVGRPQARVRPLLMASMSAVNRGKTRESAGLIAEAQQLLALTDDPSLSLSFMAHGISRACLLCLDDELDSYEQVLPRLVTGLPTSEFTLHALRSVVRCRRGRREAAREDLLAAWRLIGDWDFGSFLHIIAEVVGFVGEREIAARCRDMLAPLAGREALGGQVSVSYDGPVDRLIGLLDRVLGDLPSAEQKLRAALALAERRGFSAWVAQGRLDVGDVLSSLGRNDQARALWQAGAELAEACEMTGMVARAQERLAGGEAVLAPVRSAPSTQKLSMVREGELYLVERGGLAVRIRATRGAELLARLIEAPGQEIHVLALASDEGSSASSESNAGQALDAKALRQYRARLADLGELLAEAEARADLGRSEALRREQAALEREVARALGLGGRARQAGSTTERARVNVQRRLKDALERVSEASPELGDWLGRSLRTGTYCSFRPSP